MKSWYKYVILLAIFILVVVTPILWTFRIEISELLRTAKLQAEALGKINPIFLITALSFFPLIGIPAAIFYITSSIAYGITKGLVFSGIGVAINISLSYWLTNSALRQWIIKYLKKKGHKMLIVPPSEVKATIIAIRLMPGLPLSAQNYILGIAGVPFKSYFLLSWPTQMFWAIFFILTANTVIHQTTESVILGILGIFVIFLLIKVLRGITINKKT